MVSVIIPIFNSEMTIIETLRSVFRQTYADWEIIIVNDGSTDNSMAVVRNFMKTHSEGKGIKIIDQGNKGVASARNAGMRAAKGEYIAFLDSDDIWRETKLEAQVSLMERMKSVDFISSALPGMLRRRGGAEWERIGFKRLLLKNVFQPSCVLMKSSVIDKVGFFDEGRRFAEEGDYFYRIAHDMECVLMNEVLTVYGDNKHGFGSSGLSGNILEMERGELQNLANARARGHIGTLLRALLVVFSILKFTRRFAITKYRAMRVRMGRTRRGGEA
jgi:glycosyltransferase involved in cell wall biosynthesis